MIQAQKDRIAHLRSKGESYKKIAATLDISENTVKSYCRRNSLGAGRATNELPNTNDTCAQCGVSLQHTIGKKQKRFCSDKCRMAWWNAHPEAVNRKAVYHFRCAVCDTPFESYGNSHRKYCSRTCFGASRRSAND